MKILLISNLYEPYARGGAEIIVKRTIDGLVERGHELTLITACPFSGLASLRPQAQTERGLTIWRFYPLNLFFYANDGKWPLPFRLIWHFFDLFNVHSALVISRLLKRQQPELVITHNLMGLGYLLLPVIRKTGIRHTHVLHDIQLAVRSGLMKKGQEKAWFVNGVAAKLYQSIVKRLFGSPRRVISPSNFLLSFYEERGYFKDAKKEVLGNPIDERFLQTPIESAPSEQVRFAYVGQLAEHKGIKTLLRAFQGIQGAKLSIVGDGAMRSEVEQAAKEQSGIEYLGKLANQELPAFFASVDATILPTETYENSPTVVFESLACGRPVIVADIGGASEAIEEGKNGYTFEPGNGAELQEKIKAMMVHHREMRQRARESVQGCSSECYVRELLN